MPVFCCKRSLHSTQLGRSEQWPRFINHGVGLFRRPSLRGMVSNRQGRVGRPFGGAKDKRMRSVWNLEFKHCASNLSSRSFSRGKMGFRKTFQRLSSRPHPFHSRGDGPKVELVRRKEIISKHPKHPTLPPFQHCISDGTSPLRGRLSAGVKSISLRPVDRDPITAPCVLHTIYRSI